MPTSARAGSCCHLFGAPQCPGLLGMFFMLGECDEPLPDSRRKEGIYFFGASKWRKMYESCKTHAHTRWTKEKNGGHVSACDSLHLKFHMDHTHPPTHLQQMPSSALCEAGPRHTMWDEVGVQWPESYGNTLKLPCPAAFIPDLRRHTTLKHQASFNSSCWICRADRHRIPAYEPWGQHSGCMMNKSASSLSDDRKQTAGDRRYQRESRCIKCFVCVFVWAYFRRLLYSYYNVSVFECVYFLYFLLSVHHWFGWPSWQSDNNRQGFNRASH